MTQKNLLQSAGDGTAVPSGYVGEVRTFDFGNVSYLTSSPITSTWYSTGDLLTGLTAGVWLIGIDAITVEVQGTTSARLQLRITDGNNNALSGASGTLSYSGHSDESLSVFCVANISSTTNLRLQYRIAAVVSGTVTIAGLRPDYSFGGQRITAVRIA